MEKSPKHERLNKIETILYFIIVAAMISDIWSGKSHPILFTVSTIILAGGMVGIICIELIKLQWKQKHRQ